MAQTPSIIARWRGAWRRKSKRFKAGVFIVAAFYLCAWGADFLSPADYRFQARHEPSAPPSALHWRDTTGAWHLRPFIYRRRLTDALARTYTEDMSRAYPVGWFVRGPAYKFLGVIPAERHLFGVLPTSDGEPAPGLYLLGTDVLGRDRWAHLTRAARFSLLVGPLGALGAALLGVLLGCLAGYGGPRLESFLMRAADTVMALPVLVLILAARAAFPLELPPWRAAVLLLGIFLCVGWGEMARLVRGLVLELKQRDFVTAARSIGVSEKRILWRHIAPNLARPCLVQYTIMLPAYLLAETALSFFGVGLQEPEPSWGRMLMAANDLPLLAEHPFILLTPAFALSLFVLGVRLITDELAQTRTP